MVAFHPAKNHLVQIEPSSDAHTWQEREIRFRKKFNAGKRHIPSLFEGIKVPPDIEQIALFASGSSRDHPSVGGGKVAIIGEFMREIRDLLKDRNVMKAVIPEQYEILRALHFAAFHWR